MTIDRVVVVGAGLAGLRTIEELRSRGYPGEITLIGAEDRPPYDRPPLSKKVMTGELDDTSLRPDFAALSVDFRPGERATSLDPEGVLRTTRQPREAAAEYRFDRLVLATGATPVTLPGDGRQRVLRTMDDALELRARLEPGRKLVVAGAGWIGAELATAAASRGCEVTVLDLAATPLAAAVGPEVGSKTAAWYAAAGVRLLLNQGVDSVQPGGLALAGGGWLEADEVVTAVGVRPAVTWLEGSGLHLEAGIATDAGLRALEAAVASAEGPRASIPGIFAVGDCSSFPSRRYGRRLRFEHWDVALHAPEVAAANLLGADETYDPVPYFWSEQFGRMLQYVGYHGDADHLLWRGDPTSASWTACWLTGNRLVAALTIDRPRDLLQARKLIAARTPLDLTKLPNPDTPLKTTPLT
ncbi:MAG TPA: FAD-dependent oxidoreductase [Streptosporangiaceae bacterium]|nr:FAD-dependent oxidoreductase [Streptosporangiaceae bacterium]